MTEMTLPTPLVFELAQPWILHQGKLYQPSSKVVESDDSDFIDLLGSRFTLEEIVHPADLEQLYFRKYETQIEELQRAFLSQAVHTQFQSKKTIEEKLKNNNVLALLVDKVMPELTNLALESQLEASEGIAHDSKREMLELMAAQAPRASARSSPVETSGIAQQRRSMRTQIEREYTRFEQAAVVPQLDALLLAQIRNQQSDSILSTHIFPGMPIMLYNNSVHELVFVKDWISYFQGHISSPLYRRLRQFSTKRPPAEALDIIRENLDAFEKRYLSRIVNKLQTSVVHVQGEYYFPIFMADDRLENIIPLYKKHIEKRVKLAALDHDEFQSIQLQNLAEQSALLDRIAGLEKFEYRNAGFEKRDGSFYVYIKTPPYVLKSPHMTSGDQYLERGPAKIGVRVNFDSRSGEFIVDRPVVMNEYSHPFLHAYGEMQALCTGTLQTSSSRRQSPEQTIASLLYGAKQIIMMGYNTGNNPYKRLTKEYFRTGWLTKREADAKGLICLNER